VRGVRGLDGTLRLEVLTDLPEQRFIPGARLCVEGTERVLTLLEVTPGSPGLFIRFGEVQSRLAGERLVGAYLTIPAAEVQVPPDRVLWDEVIGVTVRDPQGEIIGEIRDLYRAGGAEVYVVHTPDGGEIDLPAVAAVIVEFAPRDGRIVADLTGSEQRRHLVGEGHRRPRVASPRCAPRRPPVARRRALRSVLQVTHE
jgi:16S rRNA processing protein RimM